MLHRLILAFTLTLLLGFSQQTALLHEISHIADLVPLSDQQDQAPQHAAHCDHCLSFSHLSHGVTGSFNFAPNLSPGAALAALTNQHYQTHFSKAYNARAPPSFI